MDEVVKLMAVVEKVYVDKVVVEEEEELWKDWNGEKDGLNKWYGEIHMFASGHVVNRLYTVTPA